MVQQLARRWMVHFGLERAPKRLPRLFVLGGIGLRNQFRTGRQQRLPYITSAARAPSPAG